MEENRPHPHRDSRPRADQIRTGEARGGAANPASVPAGSDTDPVVVSVGDLSFEPIYRRDRPRLVGQLVRRGLDHHAAQDIAHDVLCEALVLHRAGRLDLSKDPWPWLRTVALNRATDRGRRESRQVPMEAPALAAAVQTVEMPDVAEGVVFMQAMRQLPKRQQMVLMLHHFYKLTQVELAELWGTTPEAIRQCLRRAKKGVKRRLEQAGERVSAVVLFPAHLLRRVRQRLQEETVRVNTRLGDTGQAAQVAVHQLATGATALLLVLAGPAGIAPEASQAPPEPAFPAVPAPAPPARIQAPLDDRPRSGGSHGAHAASASAGGDSASGPVLNRGSERFVGEMIKPNENVSQPEDASITSIVPSPGFSEDQSLFAAGTTDCWGSTCSNVLFRSDDAGRSWSRLEGRDFHGVDLLLPPAFGAGDDRIFAMGPTGLQVSRDGGQSFAPAAVAGPAHTVGSAAVSPAFNSGDPTILIGAQTLMRYRDDLRTIEAVPWNTGTGPFEPAYAPGYPEDPRVLIGAVRFDEARGRMASGLYTCAGGSCSWSVVSSVAQSPRMRPRSAYEAAGKLHAFTPRAAFVSTDSGHTFEELSRPWGNDVYVRDLAVTGDGDVVFAGLRGMEPHPGAGLYATQDDGVSWHRFEHPLLEAGVEQILIDGEAVIVALGIGGIACSEDGGANWERRCS